MKLHIGTGAKQMLLAALVMTTMQLIVKSIPQIPPQEVVFFRALVSLVLSYVTLKKASVYLWGNNQKMLFLRGFFGTVSLVLVFASFQNLPLATAVVLQNLAPLFTAIFAMLFLKQPLKPAQLLFMSLSIVGVVLIKGFDPRVDPLYLAIAISGAIGSAAAYTVIGKLKGKENPVVVVFYFPFVAVPITGLWCYFDWVTPTGWTWIALLSIGILSQIGQILLTKAYQSDDDAATVSSMNYTSVIYGALYGIFFFGEFFSIEVILGMLLVMLGTILNLIYKTRLQK
ncbi:DMT family transporter [Flammeovirga agarivorans]|uniref:DMT family transporter n=1 Tax=Flammeovirga agarivorans TaxID=2726742 RepID=A0A7X8SGZ8_9BACT|nr:DMT family transporter [Flammeovirga agarivorans]NLR90090.1 DMT family transporter [Flammeovirga agarivorans]